MAITRSSGNKWDAYITCECFVSMPMVVSVSCCWNLMWSFAGVAHPLQGVTCFVCSGMLFRLSQPFTCVHFIEGFLSCQTSIAVPADQHHVYTCRTDAYLVFWRALFFPNYSVTFVHDDAKEPACLVQTTVILQSVNLNWSSSAIFMLCAAATW